MFIDTSDMTSWEQTVTSSRTKTTLLYLMFASALLFVVAVSAVGYKKQVSDLARFNETSATVVSDTRLLSGTGKNGVLYVADVSYNHGNEARVEEIFMNPDVKEQATVPVWFDNYTGRLWKPAKANLSSPIASFWGHVAMSLMIPAVFCYIFVISYKLIVGGIESDVYFRTREKKLAAQIELNNRAASFYIPESFTNHATENLKRATRTCRSAASKATLRASKSALHALQKSRR